MYQSPTFLKQLNRTLHSLQCAMETKPNKEKCQPCAGISCGHRLALHCANPDC